jgi:hypothetical protein
MENSMKNSRFVNFRQSVVAMVLALIACVAVPAPAQVGQATLTGTVQDASGATIAGAAITLTDTNNLTRRTATSDAHGFFTFSSLPAATYEVKFDKAGFAPLRRTIVVHIADHTEIPDIRMAVAGTKESVTVTAEQTLVTPSDTGELSYTLTAKQVQNLDIMGRSAIELLCLERLTPATSIPTPIRGKLPDSHRTQAPIA